MFFERAASAARSQATRRPRRSNDAFVAHDTTPSSVIDPNETAADMRCQDYGHVAGRLNLCNL